MQYVKSLRQLSENRAKKKSVDRLSFRVGRGDRDPPTAVDFSGIFGEIAKLAMAEVLTGRDIG
jgi:hypothetical protein